LKEGIVNTKREVWGEGKKTGGYLSLQTGHLSLQNTKLLRKEREGREEHAAESKPGAQTDPRDKKSQRGPNSFNAKM